MVTALKSASSFLKNMDLLLLLVIVIGFSGSSFPMPYFTDKRNLFNQYFVKFGWFWTSILYIVRLIVSSENPKEKQKAKQKGIVFYLVYTAAWYLFTTAFSTYLSYFGSCSFSSYGTRSLCYNAGYQWLGIDISGHCFFLIFSSLLLTDLCNNYELTNDSSTYKVFEWFTIYIRVLWLFMLAITVAYFHTLRDKILGSLIGYACFYTCKWIGNTII